MPERTTTAVLSADEFTQGSIARVDASGPGTAGLVTVELARDYQFRQMVYREEHVVLPLTQTAAPAAGQYFIRVRATNTSGYTQDAFDYYVIDSGKVYGVKCFYIQPDGTVVEDTYEE